MRFPALLLTLAALVPVSAAAQALSVDVDQAVRVSLPRPARDVIIGNPAIVDANVLDSTHLVLTGKGSGVTNLMVTDQSGAVMLSKIVVSAQSQANRVRIYRGSEASMYACAAGCQRSSTSPATGAAAPTTPAPPPQ